MMQVDLSRIEAICKAKLKVDADTVLDPESSQALIALVRKLQSLQVTRPCCSLLRVTADPSLCAQAQEDLLCSASVMPKINLPEIMYQDVRSVFNWFAKHCWRQLRQCQPR